MRLPAGGLLLALVLCVWPCGSPRAAFDPAVMESVVSVLPLWPGYEQGGIGHVPAGSAPEGSAVAICAGGYLVTALHVVARAQEIDVRLSDGRLLPARLIGGDAPSDLAVLQVEAELPPLLLREHVSLGEPVCAVGNQFGLGLSVSCGVVSALAVTDAGFNRIEDFVQTDTAINPGASGGALIDAEGRLVGMLSAIVTKDSDANIGVNFAASAALVARVTDDLIAYGKVRRGSPPGLRLSDLSREERRSLVGARIESLSPGGAPERAGLAPGDIIVALAGRRVRSLRDALTALQLQRPGADVAVRVLRAGAPLDLRLKLPE